MENSLRNNHHRQIHLVGAGIASLASAAYFIQTAVYKLLKLDKKPIPIYHGDYHPSVLFDAAETLFR